MKIALLLVLFSIVAVPVIHGATLVVGGSNANQGQYPFYALLSGRTNYCGGAIIASRIVITAAHCIYNKNPDFTVIVGTIYSRGGGQSYRTAQTGWNSNYNPNNGVNDIGFVQIQGRFQFNNNVQPIRFSTQYPAVGERLTLIGFGRLSTNNQNMPQVLQQLRVNSISWQECSNFYRGAQNLVHNGNVCTSSGRGRGGCRGDSGGPLVNMRGELVGVVSFGPSDCGSGGPDAYSSIVYYRGYINNVISQYNR